jgi:hypothetical protein
MAKEPKTQRPRVIINVRADPEYWKALGRFVEAFASIETVMFALLAFYAKMPNDRAKAVFSGTRVDASVKLIRRLIAVDDPGEERRRELELVFPQLGAINDARNDIIHYGSWVTNEGRMSTNVSRAHLPQNVTWRPVSTAVLDAMTEDLHAIATHLVLHRQLPSAEDARDRLARLLMPEPWHYRPPQDQAMKSSKPARPDQPR